MRRVGIHWEMQAVDTALLPEKAKSLGYDQLELDGLGLLEMSPWGRKRLLFEARNNQIDLSYSLVPPVGWDLSSLDEEVRRSAVHRMQELMKLLGELGGGSLSGPLYAQNSFDEPYAAHKAEHWEQSVKSLRSLTPVAEEEDVVLNLRPVNRYEHCLVNTAEQALKLIHAVNHPNFGIDLDTFHMNIEERSLSKAIEQAGIYLHCLHVRENTGLPFGQGCLDWASVEAGLTTIHYEGPIVHTIGSTNRADASALRESLCDFH